MHHPQAEHPAVLAARTEVARTAGQLGAAQSARREDVPALQAAVSIASRRLKAVRALADLAPVERVDVLMLLAEHEDGGGTQ